MSNRIIKFILLSLLLIILPIGSYFYLKKGIDYRKAIMADLSKHMTLKDTIKVNNGKLLTYSNKCTVVSLLGEKADVKSIYNQFKEAKGFQLVSDLPPNFLKEVITKKTEEENNAILQMSYKQIDSLALTNLRNHYQGKHYIIIDSLSNIRYAYDNNMEEKKKLIAHITALLPYYDEKKGK